MEELRVSLIVLALAIGAGVVARDYLSRRPAHAKRVTSKLYAEPNFDDDDLDVVRQDDADDDGEPKGHIIQQGRVPKVLKSASNDLQGELPFADGSAAEPAPKEEPAEEYIVSLSIMEPQRKPFEAASVRTVLDDAGLQFGAMAVFHHFGLNGTPKGLPVFSVAKAVEPGTFDPRDPRSFKTPGLVLFMRLPCNQDGPVVLELMLATAQLLARRLGGDILDDRQMPLTPELVRTLRESVDAFTRGQRHFPVPPDIEMEP